MTSNTVTVTRRINLGNYQHYDLTVTITDEDEFAAMARALVLMASTFNALGCKDTIDISKVERQPSIRKVLERPGPTPTPTPTPAPGEILPEFDPTELIGHTWKGRKLPSGEYALGTPSWGWDFKDKFSGEVIAVLEKGPLTIDRYEFSIGSSGNIVQARAIREERHIP